MVFGNLTVIEEGERLRLPSGQYNRSVICMCYCGNKTQVRLLHLVRLRIKSCGCLSGEHHGESKTPLYRTWRAMNDRCSCYAMPRYAKLKLTVCDQWKHSFIAFRDWALANGYKHGLQLDRINNENGYSPANCRFVTNIVNVNNRGNTYRVYYHGEERPFMEIVHEKKAWLNAAAIRTRINRGWSADDAFDKPIKEGNYKRKIFTIPDMFVSMEIKNINCSL